MYRGWCTSDGIQVMVYRGWCARDGVQMMVYRGWCTGDGCVNISIWHLSTVIDTEGLVIIMMLS